MRDTKRRYDWPRRLGRALLAAALLCALALPAGAADAVQAEIPQPVIAKPTVTIQGNLVVDDAGKPTGFYELALCVQSGRKIVDGSGTEVTEAAYAADIAVNPGHETDGTYTITYYPFRTAAATVNINTDILTPVSWDLEEVAYGTWDKAAGKYTDAALDAQSNRGIDLTATLDPDLYPDVDPDVLAGYVTDVTGATLQGTTPVSVRLEAVGNSAMTNVTVQADHYTPDAANPENNSALLTLSAATTDNKSVIFKEKTLVAVVRFAYDLNRFNGMTAVNETIGGNQTGITGATSSDAGFWLGVDVGSESRGAGTYANKLPLTWLADSTLTAAGSTNPLEASDQMAAKTRNHQVVWVNVNCADDAASLGEENTQFYYYLGANGGQTKGTGTVWVQKSDGSSDFLELTLPRTEGYRVLTADPNNTDPTALGYTFFQNLLKFDDGSLKLELVNDTTFRKATGGKGGTMVLFYDWDDSLIGSLIVGKGDVRGEVNAYVEKTMVHPDLRSAQYLENGAIPTDATKLADLTNLTDSLERDYTYRGKYSSKVDGSGVIRDENDPEPGKEYPLTNKLDYVFYKRVNTETTLEYQNAAGKPTTDRYITTQALSANADEAALYPYVYGWALVEDNSARNKSQWTVRRDAAQVENTWTTMGVGELENADPAYDLTTDPKGQSVPTTLPGPIVPGTTVGGGTGIETTYPAFVTTPPTAPATGAYSYALTGDSAYLKFADFSDMNNLLTRKNQDTIVVKAVYEPGTELLENYSYRMISQPYYNKYNEKSAAEGGAYSVQITLERSTYEHPDGQLRGVSRVREPAVRQDTTLDQKWIEDLTRDIKHDLDNPSIEVAKKRTETTFTSVDVDNGEEVTFTLSLSARQNKVDYYLIEKFGLNFVSGGTRSASNYDRYKLDHTIDNYFYDAEDADTNDAYFDQQNYYYRAGRYDVREGTHGFVLYGTLNYLMQQATLFNNGELSNAEFNTNATNAVFADANLCVMVDGAPTVPSTGAHQTTIRNALKAAAAWCEANKVPGETWNEELDCAELSYHQLQWYILGTPYTSRTAADQAKLDWCHLHKACFKDEQAADAPQSWDDIMAFAADPAKQEGIGLLGGGLTGKIEELTSLRATINGDTFASGAVFQSKIVKAVSDLNAAGQPITWANVQYAILYNAAPVGNAGETAALANYWWYDGAQSKPTAPAGLAKLVEATEDYYGYKLKDGNTVLGWRHKMTGVEDAFDAIFTGTDAVGQPWIDLTENLVAGHTVNADGTETTTSFFDNGLYADFETALFSAVQKGKNAGADPNDGEYWYRLQYVLLNPGAAWPTALHGDSSPEGTAMGGYWWHNGGKFLAVTDIKSMLEIAKVSGVGEEGAAAWNKFDFDKFSSNANFDAVEDLRYTFDGSDAIDAGDFNTFKTLVADFAKNSGVADLDPATNTDLWNQLQYFIIHKNYDKGTMDMEANAGYYWWKGGAAQGAPVAITGVDSLAAAAFSGGVNGNTAAWDNLTQAFVNARYFRKPDKAKLDTTVNDDMYGAHTDMPVLTTDELITAAEALVSAKLDALEATEPGGHHHAPPTVSWLELQHYVVTGKTDLYDAADGGFANEAAAKDYYWWHSGGPNPKKKVETGFDKFLGKLKAKQAEGGTALDDYIQTLVRDDFQADGVGLRVLKTNGNFTTNNLKKARTRLTNMLHTAIGDGADIADLTWYQIQHAMLDSTTAQGGGNGAYLAKTAAEKWWANNRGKGANYTDWRPDWLKALGDPESDPEPANLDAAEPIEEVKELPEGDPLPAEELTETQIPAPEPVEVPLEPVTEEEPFVQEEIPVQEETVPPLEPVTEEELEETPAEVEPLPVMKAATAPLSVRQASSAGASRNVSRIVIISYTDMLLPKKVRLA